MNTHAYDHVPVMLGQATVGLDFEAQSPELDTPPVATGGGGLWSELRIAVEPGGATALAALINGACVVDAREKIGILLCGANIDAEKFASLIAGTELALARQSRFAITSNRNKLQ